MTNLLTADISGLIVQVFFAVTISLMIFDKQKPPLTTSILTGLALIAFGLGGSFKAEAVAFGSILNGVLWLILAWQRNSQKNT